MGGEASTHRAKGWRVTKTAHGAVRVKDLARLGPSGLRGRYGEDEAQKVKREAREAR